ncbi:MAG: phage baseplate assembly protein V [Chloroflexota bacterium]|nr:phage baseplate assembly protein V [Chloroflexota bacterium]
MSSGLVLALPQVVVERDGSSLSPADLHALTEVRVQQRLSLPTLCELTFRDPPGPLSVAQGLSPGTTLRVSVQDHRLPLFEGEITAVEHVYGPANWREIRVRGYDMLHRLRKQQEVRAHVQVTVEDLARELTADIGLSVQAEEPGPLWQLLIQHNQSNFELLQEVAARCGLYMTVRQDTLHLVTLRGMGDPVPLTLGESLLETRIEVNGDPACRTVTATGWDALLVETHESSASDPRVGRNVVAGVSPEAVGGSGSRELVGEVAQDDTHASGLAHAELDLRVAGEVTLWGIAEGNPLLRPGTRVEVSGVEAELSGSYVLTSVTHTIDSRMAFISELSSTPLTPRTRSKGVGFTPAEVTQLDDPDGLGRVRAKLLTYAGVETGWMGVLTPGAGADKGLVIMPNVGDRVLVLFSHEDPAQGVVLGGLYGARGAYDPGVVDGSVKRYTLRTPGGQLVLLDDEHKMLRLENSDGSYLELAPERVSLHAATDLEIEAPGKAIVIRGHTIDFRRE